MNSEKKHLHAVPVDGICIANNQALTQNSKKIVHRNDHSQLVRPASHWQKILSKRLQKSL